MCKRVHLRDQVERPLSGVLATRSADRPNPIGLHPVLVRKRYTTEITEHAEKDLLLAKIKSTCFPLLFRSRYEVILSVFTVISVVNPFALDNHAPFPYPFANLMNLYGSPAPRARRPRQTSVWFVELVA